MRWYVVHCCTPSVIWKLHRRICNSGTYALQFKFGRNAAEETKNICCAKCESLVDPRAGSWWFKKFYSGCMNIDDQTRSGWSKTKAVLKAIEANPLSNAWRVSGELGNSQSSVLHHVYDLGKNITELCLTSLKVISHHRMNHKINEGHDISKKVSKSCRPQSQGGDPEAPFSKATILKSRGGRYSFLWIAPLYPWYVPNNTEGLARKYQVQFFESLVWLNQELNPCLPGYWRTLYPLANIYIYIYIYIYISKLAGCSQRRLGSSLFISYYTEV